MYQNRYLHTQQIKHSVGCVFFVVDTGSYFFVLAQKKTTMLSRTPDTGLTVSKESRKHEVFAKIVRNGHRQTSMERSDFVARQIMQRIRCCRRRVATTSELVAPLLRKPVAFYNLPRISTTSEEKSKREAVSLAFVLSLRSGVVHFQESSARQQASHLF